MKTVISLVGVGLAISLTGLVVVLYCCNVALISHNALIEEQNRILANMTITSVAVADMNGDGFNDLVIDSRDGLAVMIGDPYRTKNEGCYRTGKMSFWTEADLKNFYR